MMVINQSLFLRTATPFAFASAKLHYSAYINILLQSATTKSAVARTKLTSIFLEVVSDNPNTVYPVFVGENSSPGG
jgi:hypothetical protein